MSRHEHANSSNPTIVGILDTTGIDRINGGCQPYGLHLLTDDGTLIPATWMTPGTTYTLHHDGTSWTVTGGQLATFTAHRLTRDGQHVSTVPTLFRDEPLAPNSTYQFAPIPGPEPAWLIYQLG